MTEKKETLSKEEAIAQYATGIEQLDKILTGLSEDDLNLDRGENSWSIRQIVHHISDAEDIWQSGIKAALANPGCTYDISWYRPNNQCDGPLLYDKRPIKYAIELFKAARRQVVGLLTHIPDAWDKTIIFSREDLPEKKEYSVSDIIRWQVPHLQIHLEQIHEIRDIHRL